MEDTDVAPSPQKDEKRLGLFTPAWPHYNRPERIVTLGHYYPLGQIAAAKTLLRESKSPYSVDSSANPCAIDRNLGWTKAIQALNEGRQWPLKRLVELIDPMLEEGIALVVVPTHFAYQADWPVRTLARRLAQRGRIDATSCLVRDTTIRRILFGGPSTRALHRQTIRVENAELISGKAVLLLDDIAKSGASLTACRELLYKAGAAMVQAMALARIIVNATEPG